MFGSLSEAYTFDMQPITALFGVNAKWSSNMHNVIALSITLITTMNNRIGR